MTRHKIMTVFPWMPFEKSTVPVPYRTHDILGRLAAYFCFQIHHPHVWKFAGTVPVPVLYLYWYRIHRSYFIIFTKNFPTRMEICWYR